MRTATLFPLLLAFPLFLACGDKDDTGTDGTTDGGTEDGGMTDGGTTDGGAGDGGTTDGGTEDVVEYDVLGDYLLANGMDLPDMTTDWIVSAQSVFEGGTDSYFIADLRTGDNYEAGVVDFEEGHIPGAHSVALGDLVSYVEANNTENKTVLVVCYTGTTAGHGAMALRLAGHDAVVLKFGMSGWHSDFDLWTPNLGNAALDYDGAWVSHGSPDLPDFAADPLIATGMTEGDDILLAQIDANILSGLNKVSATDVLSSPNDYQVINYWGEEDYLHYGHVAGAYQVTPGELTVDTLNILDPTMPIVVYCWTGQTASMVSAWLQVMGYDASAMPFSANTLIYDNLESHTFTGAMDYAYDTGM